MNIKFNNRDEQTQILNILLNLGYRWHGEKDEKTSKEIIDKWEHARYDCVRIYAVNCISFTYSQAHDTCIEWSESSEEILSKLKNYNKLKTIRIKDVGSFSATVCRDFVKINSIKIPHKTILDVYETFDTIDPLGFNGTLYITTKNEQENRDLLNLLHSMGWELHGFRNHNDINRSIKTLEGYPSKVLRNGQVGGNYQHYTDDREYTMADLGEIYDILSKKNFHRMDKIGDYDTFVYRDCVNVGCQTITKDKVKEIIDAIEKINQ